MNMNYMNNEKKFFLNPIHVTHKKYEAMRALCVDKLRARDAADRFGYSVHTINAMKRDFAKAINNHLVDSSCFFVTNTPGRHIDINKAGAREKIIELRKQNHSVLDIKSILNTEDYDISHDYIYNVLTQEGFARLPRRTQTERKKASSNTIKAPKSQPINWAADNEKTFHSERGIGILPFLPLLAWLKVDQWVKVAGYPETNELNNVQYILSFIALKLSGYKRYSHDDLWAMDRGLGLFSELNVLPKGSALSSYSYRTNRRMDRKFLTEMFYCMNRLGLLSSTINMDFTAIPHWGDLSVLENNWSGKRGKALKSVLAALCQDPDTGIFSYADGEIKHPRQFECVLEFVDFWKQSGENPACLIFDSKFTTYENLEKLDRDNIKFITIRRRGKKLIENLKKISKEDWNQVRIEGIGRKYKKVKVNESEIILPDTDCVWKSVV